MNQKQLLTECVSALYVYLTMVAGATHNDRRPGLSWLPPDGVRTKSCGAFRAWAIFALYEKVLVAADGYRVRSDACYHGRLFVNTTDGYVIFPSDDSRTSHSLEPYVIHGEIGDQRVVKDALVDVTNDDGAWTGIIPMITQKLQEGTRSLEDAVSKYDRELQERRRQERASMLEAARNVFK